MEKRGISVIIPDHRGLRTIREPLDSLAEQSFENFDVQVLDDTPDSMRKSLLLDKYPFIRFTTSIEGKRTLPLKQRINQCEGEYIVIVSPQVRLDPNFLSVVSRYFSENPAAHILSCKVMREYSAFTIYEIGMFISTTGKLMRLAAEWKDTGDAELFFPSVFAPSASVWAFRKSLLEMTGGFTHSFYSYFNALELCFRCWKAGFSCNLLPEAIAYCREELPLWEGFREPGMFLKLLERKFQTYFPESFIKAKGRILHRSFQKQYTAMVGGKGEGLFPELKGLSFLWKSLVPENEKAEAWAKLSVEDVENLLIDEEEFLRLTGALKAVKTPQGAAPQSTAAIR